MTSELLSAQTVLIGGTGGDQIQAYLARPGGDGAGEWRSAGRVADRGRCCATDYLRSLTTSNGRVGVIGYGAGGRQAVLAARNIDFDAAVDCYGEYVVGARSEGMFPFQVTNIVDQLPRLRAPLLGLFGKEDNYPSPEQVAELDEILDEENKPHA